jgi:hypothetical protein
LPAATKKKPKKLSERPEAYEKHKQRVRLRQQKQSQDSRDIGPIPKCTDLAAVERYAKSFREFCEEVLSDWFTDPWSEDHLKTITKIENSVLRGEVFALAMPRASGKSTLIKAALLWAILYGYRKYVVLVAADKDAANGLLESLKTVLETNDRLADLYPEACHPARALDGNSQRTTGQLLDGKRTHISWKSSKIVLASVPGAKCSGAIVECFGILGRIRGANHTLPSGESVRPDLFMIDDPQTDRSAETSGQVNKRLKVVNGAVLGLAGPGKSIAGFAAVTVIMQDDLADQLLDREKYPDWKGERFKLVYQWPTGKKAADYWDEYGILRAEGLKNDRGLGEATAFYKQHRKEMDLDAVVAWESRYDKEAGEISALQHAYNLRFKTPDTFDAEYQNDPTPPEEDVETLTVAQVEAKTNGFNRGQLPPAADLVTAFVDVQGKALYWMVCGWESANFNGYVMEYGAWPKQSTRYFTLRTLNRSLATKYPRIGLEARLRKGLFELLDYLDGLEFRSPDRQLSLRVRLIGIDAAWGPSTRTVQTVALEHKRRNDILPTYGRGLKPTDRPMSEWAQKPGERKGAWWIIRPTMGGVPHLVVDSNAAKSFVNARWNVALGDPGSLSIYAPEHTTEHRMLAEQTRAERVQTLTVQGGRSGEVWTLPPAKPDNHFWDCEVGNATMASILGAKLEDQPRLRRPRRKQARQTTLKV